MHLLLLRHRYGIKIINPFEFLKLDPSFYSQLLTVAAGCSFTHAALQLQPGPSVSREEGKEQLGGGAAPYPAAPHLGLRSFPPPPTRHQRQLSLRSKGQASQKAAEIHT